MFEALLGSVEQDVKTSGSQLKKIELMGKKFIYRSPSVDLGTLTNNAYSLTLEHLGFFQTTRNKPTIPRNLC